MTLLSQQLLSIPIFLSASSGSNFTICTWRYGSPRFVSQPCIFKIPTHPWHSTGTYLKLFNLCVLKYSLRILEKKFIWITMEKANGFQNNQIVCRIDNYGHAIYKEWYRGILSQMSSMDLQFGKCLQFCQSSLLLRVVFFNIFMGK